MSTIKVPSVPPYRLHKASGRGYVNLNGRRVYLGSHDLPETRASYDQLIAEWLANGRQRHKDDPNGLTVNEVLVGFWRHVEGHYRKPDGTPTTEVANFRSALRPLKKLYGDTPAAAFGPRALKAVRQWMVEQGCCRTYANKNTNRIRRVFKWGVAEELLPSRVHHGLQAVEALKRGRTEARETKGVRPVADATIDRTLEYLTPTLRAMVEVHRLTGMRPSEVCMMRTCDLDMSGHVWVYRPDSHKTEHLGRERTVFVGPKAQEVLRRRLKPNLAACLFNPRESEAERLAERHAARKTRMSCGNVPGSNRSRRPRRKPGEKYDCDSYRQAVARACERAGIPSWSPGQIRHSFATEVRREYGLEAAQVLLGHSYADVTQVYAERDVARAVSVAAKVG